FKQLDVFVSNARPEVPAFFQPPLQITLEQWDTAFDSQPKAFLVGVREAIPLMATGGRIVALTYAEGSRTGGLQPWVGMGSAKAAWITGQVIYADGGASLMNPEVPPEIQLG